MTRRDRRIIIVCLSSERFCCYCQKKLSRALPDIGKSPRSQPFRTVTLDEDLRHRLGMPV